MTIGCSEAVSLSEAGSGRVDAGAGVLRRLRFLLVVAAVSGMAMALAFPPFNQADAAWFVLVPLLILLRFSTPRHGFYLGFAWGAGFWLLSLSWLMELRHNGGPVMLVAFGLVGLSAWCALFSGLFGLAVARIWRGGDAPFEWAGLRRSGFEASRALATAVLWVGGEYLRATVLSGFAWNMLGVSQHQMLPVAQVASLGGVYAVSLVIVLVNAGIAGTAVRIWRNVRGVPGVTRRHLDLMLALTVLVVVFAWGTRRLGVLRGIAARADTVAIAAVNPSLPCIFEAHEEGWRAGYRRLSEATEQLARIRPDLVVWPETVLYVSMPDVHLEAEMLDFAWRLRVPILAGGTEAVVDAAGRTQIFNSTFLFGTNGVVEAVYRKQHLVPFGEFIPFDKRLPFLQRLAPAGISCTPGAGPVVMSLAGGRARISPLICFEDTVPGLSRAAVRAGAQILVVQSNDAWFDGSSEPWQHHAQAVFRAIEQGVPMVRSSNRGVTAVISASGASTEDAEYFSLHVPVLPNPGETGYARFGDWALGIPAALLMVLRLVIRRTGRDAAARPASV